MLAKGERTKEQILDTAERLVLQRGYTGTSVDTILEEAGLTKGAFFHHFKSKAHLARALLERFWQRDQALFDDISRRAGDLAEDPLQEAILWFKLLEETMTRSTADAPTSCLFASYLYEREQFDPEVLAYVETGFREWTAYLEQPLQRLLDWRAPRSPVTATELAEFAIAMIEGGFILAQAYEEPQAVVRQSARFRQYLQLQFAG